MSEIDDNPEGMRSIEAGPAVGIAGYGHEDSVYRLVVWCFVVASVSHLLLADAWQWSWLPANLVYLAGLGFLIWRGAFAGWVLSAVGLAVPLLFHRDQLTQSLYLLFVATGGALSTGWAAWRLFVRQADERSGARPSPETWAFLRTVQWLTILAYALAFFHKLNSDFLDPQTSCAVYGLREVTDYWHLPSFEMSADLATVFPLGILLAEAGIAVLHLVCFRRVAWTIALLFHVFLTFTMAPAFVFVMAVGHAAFATGDDLVRMRTALERRGVWIGAAATGVTAVSLWLHAGPPMQWSMIPREWLLWGTLGLLLVAFPPWRGIAWRIRPSRRPRSQLSRWMPAVAATVFLANGLTPYLGVQFQHTAAMVSNLRIDRGCWNHLLVPESVRLRDEYVRIDEVYFGEPGAIPDYEQTVRRQLWSPPRIRQMRRNWCRPEIRPLYLRGTHLGEPFEIDDLCAGEPLPFGEGRLFGEAVFGDFLRFQKNLERDCPQRCIH